LQGNIILTDHQLKVISLIREVKVTDKSTGEERKLLTVGMNYDASSYQNLTLPSEDVLLEYVTNAGNESVKNGLRLVFKSVSVEMIESCLSKIGLQGSEKACEVKDRFFTVFGLVKDLVNRLDSQDYGMPGFIRTSLAGRRIEFGPLLGSLPLNATQLDTFNSAADEYFYQLEETKIKDRKRQVEDAVVKKFDAIKREQEFRISSLESGIENYQFLAQVIEDNIKSVEEAILVINTGLQNDLSWKDLEALIKVEQNKGRPIALLISKLMLIDFLVQLRLPFGSEHVLVDVDVRLGGHANANRYYELRKNAMEKLVRTRSAFEQAMKSAEAKVRADSRKDKRRDQHLIPKRKTLWFEKYNWFISSDSYLVISGKDMHQNEYLVKRLLKSGDVYVHADLTGASSVIIKNHRKPADDSDTAPEIPHRTLVEAGAFSLCFSKAWDAKIVTSAWWVFARQVSKTAPSGEFLPTGSFMIRGKKNFLPPSPLILGFGFMFILDEESSAKRKTSRLSKEAAREAGGETGTETVGETARERKYIDQLADQSGGGLEEYITTTAKEVESLQIAPSKAPKPENKEQEKKKDDSTQTSVGTRGKHGKQKKIKEKYRHQDEEERKMRLELLGSKAKQPVIKVAQSPKPVKVAVVKKAPATVIVEDDTVEEELPGIGELGYIDSIVGNPGPEEIVSGIIAAAAPFSVMQHYKYRVKLLPGTLKRGTAAKTAVSLMLSENRSLGTPRERDFIRSVTDTELNSTIPGRVRISGSGVELSKVKKSLKKNNNKK
jgi:predicted ribosome quality control (RQC) complex YloA/Tae2 family protein